MKKVNEKILVTKPFLPNFKEYSKYLEQIWDNNWLTNNGPMVQELEKQLKEYLGVKHLFFLSNGTIALQIAIKALDLKGEIITTPFTYVATTNSIIWEGCTPVFVDIDPENFGIDPSKIEAAITPKTQAIMAVHVYGNPNKVKQIEKIAKKHNLKVIYDAAHCFGTKIGSKSVLKYGDISTLSFHATKVFHTIEGGAIATNYDGLARKISLYRSFGHVGDDHITVGINGKNSEVHAAMGLVNLKQLPKIINRRKKVAQVYDAILDKNNLRTLKLDKNVVFNYAYYPVIFESEEALLTVKAELEKANIFPRRYFYPSLNTVQFVNYTSCPVSESISKRALCLPFYDSLDLKKAKQIAQIVNNVLEKFQQSRPTLTIGIPAHNEERNIGNLIDSIFRQTNRNYNLEKIVVVLDGSTDKTEEVVKKLAEENPLISIFSDSKRKGKITRLNYLYAINQSDYILTLDADLILDKENDIDLMFEKAKDEGACMISGNLVPLKRSGWWGEILSAHQELWDQLRYSLNNGNHIANSFGCANLLTKSFSKSIDIPSSITCDEEYLYVVASKRGGFRFARNTAIKYIHAANLTELRLQATRFMNERYSLVPYFGEEVVKLHSIPLIKKVVATFKCLVQNPLFTVLALGLNLYLRLFPKHDPLNNLGMWEMVESTKALIS